MRDEITLGAVSWTEVEIGIENEASVGERRVSGGFEEAIQTIGRMGRSGG